MELATKLGAAYGTQRFDIILVEQNRTHIWKPLLHEVAAGTLCTTAVREFAADPLVFSICTLNGRSVSPAAKAFADTVVDYCRRYRR